MKNAELLFGLALVTSTVITAVPAIARETATKAEVTTATKHDNGDVTLSRSTTHKLTNTNGTDAADRDTGLDRAEDRMSAEGVAHNRALEQHTPDAGEERSTTTTTTTSRSR
jgi:hypothetical protein